jgi:cobalt-zinc-cadmium efflux system protein
MRDRVNYGNDKSDWAGRGIRPRVALALWLTVGFVFFEASAGILANSLALLTDAAHNLTDVVALALSMFALRLQARPASPERTYGFHRVGILVALVNSGGLMVMSLLVLLEAYHRILEPPNVQAWPLMAVGAAAFLVNLVTALLIRRRGETDLNLRSTFLHLMGDVASTAAAVAAGVGIYLTGANWLDPAASAIIAVLILVAAWRVLREAIGILLEATPPDVDMNALVNDVLSVQGVLDVHDLHVWSLSKNLRTMSAHVLTDDAGISAGDRLRSQIIALLAAEYNIGHVTLQLESGACGSGELFCEMESRAHAHPV